MSDILDPRRFAADKAAAAARATDDARVENQAARRAAEDAALLEAVLADLAELRALAMGMARAVAAGAAVDAGTDDDLPPPSRRCARDSAPARAGGAGTADGALNGLARTVRLTAALDRRRRAERARGLAAAGSAVRAAVAAPP